MVIESYGLSPQVYADDTQVYGSCRPSAVTTFMTKVFECVEATTSWMRSNRLQPNPEKTEVLQTYCVAMFRLVASAASNPSLGADSHTPDVGGCFGPLPTGLRK